MKRVLFLMFVICGVLLFAAHTVQAIPITVDFTAQNLTSGKSFIPSPIDQVSGTIIYDAASTTANINSLISINLTINGYTYGLSEVGFISPYFGGSASARQIIGGSVNGVNGTHPTENTNDFWLVWDQSTLAPLSFNFCLPNYVGVAWWATDPTDIVISVRESSPVPIPGALVLFGSGLVGLAGYGRKRFKK
jgi:hypothetical protein